MKIKKFNENVLIKDDGWNEDEMSELMEFVAATEKLGYEIRNARRGSYALDGDEPEDLLAYLKNLSEDLNNIIDEYEYHV